MKPGLCLESGEFVPADELNALPIDVAVPDQPSPFDVPTMNHIARRKLGELVADGHDVCGLMIQRQNADGTVARGAVSAGGMVIWWHPERAQIGQGVPDVGHFINLLVSAAFRKGELWERCQGKGWPEAESDEFTKLRDKTIPDAIAQLQRALASAPPAPHPAFAFRECEDSQAGIAPQDENNDVAESVNETNAVLASRYFELLKVVDQYEKNGVTCQTFRHFISEPCAECNSPGRCCKQEVAPPPKPQPLSDEQIAEIAMASGAYDEQLMAFARAIESAATEPLLQRIAELERQLEEARKQMEAQKDEWLSWEAKRRELEADAGRWREWEQGRGLTVVVPTPTDDKPDRKVTVIYSPNQYTTYPVALRKAIDAAMQKGQS